MRMKEKSIDVDRTSMDRTFLSFFSLWREKKTLWTRPRCPKCISFILGPISEIMKEMSQKLGETPWKLELCFQGYVFLLFMCFWDRTYLIHLHGLFIILKWKEGGSGSRPSSSGTGRSTLHHENERDRPTMPEDVERKRRGRRWTLSYASFSLFLFILRWKGTKTYRPADDSTILK